MEFQTIILNYNAKSLIEPEIFGFFQHKVERKRSETYAFVHFLETIFSNFSHLIHFSIFVLKPPFGYFYTLKMCSYHGIEDGKVFRL